MTGCLVKSIILYILIISILLLIKPCIFYYDINKTKLKPWYLFRETNNPNDLINFYLAVIFTSILCFLIGYNV